jgi:hypothetical protein
MNDAFENELSAMFEQSPAFVDNAAFAAAVTARLERRAQARVRLTWAAGAIGGALAVLGWSQGAGVELWRPLADVLDLSGASTTNLWICVGVGLAAWATLPLLTGSES